MNGSPIATGSTGSSSLWGARIPIVAILGSLLLLILSSAAQPTGLARDLLNVLTAVLFFGGLVVPRPGRRCAT